MRPLKRDDTEQPEHIMPIKNSRNSPLQIAEVLFEPDEGSWRAVGSEEVDGVLGWQPIPEPERPEWVE